MERIQAAILKAKQQRSQSGEIPHDRPKSVRSNEGSQVWNTLSKIAVDPARMDSQRIVSFAQSNPVHFTFDTMRAKLLRLLRQNNWTTVGFTSASQHNGKTMVCLNLAFSLAHQKGSRTVLCDLDLRMPRVADTLGLRGDHSIDSFLKGQASIEETFKVYRSELAIGFCNHPADDPAELLQNRSTETAMKSIREKLNPDVILVDLPPMQVADDVMSFAPNLDGIFLVAAAEMTTLNMIEKYTRELSEQTNVLGVILNKCRYPGDNSGQYNAYY